MDLYYLKLFSVLNTHISAKVINLKKNENEDIVHHSHQKLASKEYENSVFDIKQDNNLLDRVTIFGEFPCLNQLQDIFCGF